MSDICTSTSEIKEQLNALKQRIRGVNFPPNYLADFALYNRDYEQLLEDYNCYAYAMQFNIPLSHFINCNKEEIYCPGFLSGSIQPNEPYSIDSVINCFINDCKFLGLSCKEVDFRRNLRENAYRIGILFETWEQYSYDFHFIRQNDDLSWSEKRGTGGPVSLLTRPDGDCYYELVKVMEISRNI